MTLRISPLVRGSIIDEMLRIFDTGAEVRFFTGAQPVSPDTGAFTWDASRPLTVVTEPASLSGQPVTFMFGTHVSAQEYADVVTEIATVQGEITTAQAAVTAAQAAEAAAQAVYDGYTGAQASLDAAVVTANAVKDGADADANAAEALHAQMLLQYNTLLADNPTSLAVALALAAVDKSYAQQAYDDIGPEPTPVFVLSSPKLLLLEAAQSTVTVKLAEYNAAVVAQTTAQTDLDNAQATLDSFAPEDPEYAAALADRDAALSVLTAANALVSTKSNEHYAAIGEMNTRQSQYDTALVQDNYANDAAHAAWAVEAGPAHAALIAATAAYDTAVLNKAHYDVVVVLPEVVAMKTAADNQGVVATSARTVYLGKVILHNNAIAAASMNGTLTAEALTARNLAIANTSDAESVLIVRQTALTTKLGIKQMMETTAGSHLAAIPASGWCRIIHPTYPDIHLDGTYGPESGSPDFILLTSAVAPSLSGLQPLSITFAAV